MESVTPPYVRAFARVSAPLVAKLEVAVAPKYAGPYALKSEVEALPNCCKTVQVFALPVLRERVPAAPPTSAPKVPLYEREPPMVAVVVETLESPVVPLPYKSWLLVKVVWPVPPFAIGSVPVTSAVSETLAHVATPAPLSERTNWLVQEEPPYATTPPVELARWRALVTLVIAKEVAA